jgi:energy-coupling factor transporter ATP-binding protein EcfA2
MAALKTNRLSHIQDEVKDLHPLLDKIFRKMPRFIDLEYTQGNREMGADFVIARRDDTFGHTEYIGVVAKIGDVQQNFSDVDRQIDECSIPRLFRNGKDKIYLDEVWVAFTGHVTNNAKDKIHEKYKTRRIIFIGGRKLEAFIDEYMPSFWNSVPLETGDYLTALKLKTTQLDKSVNLIHVGDENLYIEQEIFSYPRQEYRLKFKKLNRSEKKIDIHEAISKENFILIEGSMGSGKSKFIRHLAMEYSEPSLFTEKKLLPITVSFRDLIEQYKGSIEELIKSRINDKIKNELKNDFKYLVLIDGIDEKKISSEEQLNVLKELSQFIQDNPSIKVLATSRPIDVLEKTVELDNHIASYRIKALSFNKTVQFITSICKKFNIKDRIVEDLKKSPLFKELPQSPIAIILLANLLNESPRDLPSSLTELYSKYFEWVLGRWDISKGIQSQKEYEALNNIVMNLAKYMLINDILQISFDEAKNFFTSYLKTRNLGIDAEELFNILVERTDIVLINQEANTLAFKHRTFAEFFYANASLRDRDMLIDKRAFNLYWMNSFFFYVGLLRDAPEIISELTNLEPNNEFEEWLKILNMPNFLMAAYSSPYEAISESITKSILESAKLYMKVTSGEEESFLSTFPRMHILWIFQALIRNNYSYEFFIEGLENAALQIKDGQYDDKLKMYSLFFLNVAYIDASKNNSFDFLLNDFASKLPLDLALAYKHEVKTIKEKTTVMKKQEKRVTKTLENNQLRKLIKEFYENPIKAPANKDKY